MRKILVADASESWQEQLVSMLSQNYQVFSCADGRKVLELVQRSEPDVLVMDLMLPGCDGLSVLKGLSERSFRPRIIVTGRYFSEYVSAALERYRVDLALLKPCAAQGIADRVHELLMMDATHTVKEQDPYDLITALLAGLNIPRSQQGFRFLRTGLQLLLEDPNQMLTKQLYPAIGAQHNTNAINVEKSMRTAIRTAWSRQRSDAWRRYFTAAPNGEIPCPTSGQFLLRMADTVSSCLRHRA